MDHRSNIRNVRTTDACDITLIYNHYVATSTATFDTEAVDSNHFAQLIEAIADKYPFLIYEEDDLVKGFAYAHRWKSKSGYDITAEVTEYVAPGFINHGIGSALMEVLIEQCRVHCIRNLIACVTSDNIDSIRFHERFGFTTRSFFPNVGIKFGKEISITDLMLDLKA